MDKRKKNALFALLSLIGMALFVFMLFELYTLREYRTSEEVFLENGVRWQLGYAPNIRSLDICDNSGTFPPILSKLPNLTVLRLTSEKPFRPEDKNFEHVKQLNLLYISAPSIDIASTRLYDIKIIMLEPLETGEIPDIPEDSKVKNLFILAGGLSKLPHIPPHTLEVLRISGTTLEDFSGICVPGIKSLCIENNPHAQWQKNVAQMNELGSLTWRNNALDHYPQELSELTKLTSLSLSKNNITAIPETWIPNHPQLIANMLDNLNSGGCLAVQIPLTDNMPMYRILSDLVKDSKWSSRISGIREFHSLKTEDYYDLLVSLSTGFVIWETSYVQTVAGYDGVIEWYRGSGLRPYLAALEQAAQKEFIDTIKQRLHDFYSTQSNGMLMMRFPRLFFVAYR